jgi:hypothetical protein
VVTVPTDAALVTCGRLEAQRASDDRRVEDCCALLTGRDGEEVSEMTSEAEAPEEPAAEEAAEEPAAEEAAEEPAAEEAAEEPAAEEAAEEQPTA